MTNYKVTVEDVITYYVEAPDEDVAVNQALSYWDERMPEIAVEKIIVPTKLSLERAKFIKQFDEYLKKTDVCEEVYDSMWLTTFPDGADEDEILEIASDDETWLDLVQCFARCCRTLGIID